jgi:hypothetical protein
VEAVVVPELQGLRHPAPDAEAVASRLVFRDFLHSMPVAVAELVQVWAVLVAEHRHRPVEVGHQQDLQLQTQVVVVVVAVRMIQDLDLMVARA